MNTHVLRMELLRFHEEDKVYTIIGYLLKLVLLPVLICGLVLLFGEWDVLRLLFRQAPRPGDTVFFTQFFLLNVAGYLTVLYGVAVALFTGYRLQMMNRRLAQIEALVHKVMSQEKPQLVYSVTHHKISFGVRAFRMRLLPVHYLTTVFNGEKMEVPLDDVLDTQLSSLWSETGC